MKLYSADGSRIIYLGDRLVHWLHILIGIALYAETREHWETLSKILKHKNIAYFSTRYVNKKSIYPLKAIVASIFKGTFNMA